MEHIEISGNTATATATAATEAANKPAGIPIDIKPKLMSIQEYADKHPGAINAAKTTAKYSLIIGLAVAISEVIDFVQKR